jgi:hypothetical protein
VGFVQRDYDIFERRPISGPIWRGHVAGLPSVCGKLEEIAAKTGNDCFAIHLPTKEIVALRSGSGASVTNRKRLLFQIAYDSTVANERSRLLRLCGYEIVTAIGNQAAQAILNPPRPWDLFLVEVSSAGANQEEILCWLKGAFPGVPIVAINSRGLRKLPGADFNIKADGTDEWLTSVNGALRTA